MFKTWQIFIFSLVPLALVFAGVIIGSMDGVDSELEVFPTRAPHVEATTAPPPPAEAGDTLIQLIAKDIKFDQRALSAAAGGQVTVVLDNRDDLPHNFALYTDNSLDQKIFVGDIETGPIVSNYGFKANTSSIVSNGKEAS